MAAPSLARAVLLAVAVSALPSCSGLAALGEGGTSLAGPEQEAVRAQSQKALAEGRFNAAWNEEVAAGADRERLEAIAVAALAARSRHTKDMFDALRKRFGALDAKARSRVDALVLEARAAGRWGRALDLELLTADDPPTYKAAWKVYRDAPPSDAPSMLEAIQDARHALEESSD